MEEFEDPLTLPSMKDENHDNSSISEERILVCEGQYNSWSNINADVKRLNEPDLQCLKQNATECSDDESSAVVSDKEDEEMVIEEIVKNEDLGGNVSKVGKEVYYANDKNQKKNGFTPHFICNLCSKIIKGRYPYKVHLASHTGDRPYSCTICPKTFTRKQILNEHMALHSGLRPFVCHVCQKSFAKKGTLSKHLVVHTGDRSHVCDICDRKFAQRSGMMQHRLIHTGARPFSCNMCDKNFASKYVLNRHALSHNAGSTDVQSASST